MCLTDSYSNFFAVSGSQLKAVPSLNRLSFLCAKPALIPYFVSLFVEPRSNHVAHEKENAELPIIKIFDHLKGDTRTMTPHKGDNEPRRAHFVHLSRKPFPDTLVRPQFFPARLLLGAINHAYPSIMLSNGWSEIATQRV